MNAYDKKIITPDNADVQAALWNMRILEEGALWGEAPSETALLLKEAFDSARGNVFKALDVLTMGPAYGRDEMFLAASSGAQITTFEVAEEGVKLGKKLAKINNVGDRINWENEDFSKTRKLKRNFYDAFSSHRAFHLLTEKQVKMSVKKIVSSLKDGGIISIAARNFSDFNSEQMRWISEKEGIAEYTLPKREGHVINFWDEAKFRRHFGENFTMPTFHSSHELESKGNNVQTNFTIMVAYKMASSKAHSAGNDNITIPNNSIDVAAAAVRRAASLMGGGGSLPIPAPAYSRS
jgi:hypothetical protein